VLSRIKVQGCKRNGGGERRDRGEDNVSSHREKSGGRGEEGERDRRKDLFYIKSRVEESPRKEGTAQESPRKEVTAQVSPRKEGTAQESPRKEVTAQESPRKEVTAQESPRKEATAPESPRKEVTAEESPRKEVTTNLGESPKIEINVGGSPQTDRKSLWISKSPNTKLEENRFTPTHSQLSRGRKLRYIASSYEDISDTENNINIYNNTNSNNYITNNNVNNNNNNFISNDNNNNIHNDNNNNTITSHSPPITPKAAREEVFCNK
jgi:hypothetical protein